MLRLSAHEKAINIVLTKRFMEIVGYRSTNKTFDFNHNFF